MSSRTTLQSEKTSSHSNFQKLNWLIPSIKRDIRCTFQSHCNVQGCHDETVDLEVPYTFRDCQSRRFVVTVMLQARTKLHRSTNFVALSNKERGSDNHADMLHEIRSLPDRHRMAYEACKLLALAWPVLDKVSSSSNISTYGRVDPMKMETRGAPEG
jgi:hypothetical protein